MADAVTVTKVIEVDVKASAAANAHIRDIAESTKRIEDAAGKSGNALQQLTGWVKGFVGFQIFELVGDKVLALSNALQQASDSSRQLEERMKLVTGNSDSARAAFEGIIDIAVRQGRELDGVAKLYERLTRSSEQLGVTQKGVGLITEGMAASLRLAGAGTQEANAAMLQFSQAIASGRLGGDEFRSLMENDTVLMKGFADALGVTMGQFRQMSKDGKLDAETLQKAMFTMGDDGKNVLQRMMEQAEKLPKTFDQSVNGVKASIVDYINALQQLGDHTQSFLVTILQSFTNKLREMAQLTRDQATIEAAIAKATGGAVKAEETPEAPFASRRAQDIIDRIGLTKKQIVEAENEVKRQQQKSGSSMGFLEKLLDQGEMERAIGRVNALKGTLSGLEQLRAQGASQDESDLPGGGFVSGKAQSTPPKVKKGPHQETDAEFIAKTTLDLQKQTTETEKYIGAIDEVTAKIEEYKQKIATLKHTLPQSQIDEALASFATTIQANVAAKREYDFQKLLSKATQAQEERDIAKYQSDLKRELDDYQKEHLTKDPFEGAEERINKIDSLIVNPATTEEQAKILYQQRHAIREKAAKQLLGEKDPLKSVADQMADSWKSAFDTMENNLLDFNKSVKQTIEDMVQSVLNSFAKIAMNRAFAGDAETVSKGVGSFFSGILNYFGSANGSAFGPGGVRLFGKGDVVNQPTNFSYNGGRSAGQMGEAGPEAIMPLNRDSSGRLGVSTAPVNVIINNNNGSKTTTTQQPNAQGGVDIHVMVDDMVEASLGSGRYDKVMNKAYGVGRKGA